MTPIVLYAVAFAALSTLAGFLLAVRRVPFAARLAVSLTTPWLALAVWQAARPPIGWPEAARPPQNATLVSGFVRTPVAGDAGEIDLWLEPPGSNRPRAYRLPYSRALHHVVAAALGALRATHGGVHLVVQPTTGGASSRLRTGGVRIVEAKLPAKP